MRHDKHYLAQGSQSAQRKQVWNAFGRRDLCGLLCEIPFLEREIDIRFRADKKTGRKTDSPPGLKLGVMTANDFSRSLTALGANAFFSWLIFSWQLFFAFWPSAFPPFNPQMRRVV